MFEREAKLCHFALSYCRKLAQDIPEDKLATLPAPGMNHPAWILGHLAVVGDSGLRLLSQPAQCPREWRRLFGTGSTPIADRTAYPACQELLGAIDSIYGALIAAAREAPAELVDALHSAPVLKQELPMVGDLLAHILTVHFAMHLGQISAWRKTQGLMGVLGL